MYVPFDQLPPEARIWIYQANRALTEDEIQTVQPLLSQFAAEWTSHGRNLHASAAFLHRQFLVLGLDEAAAGASGCSIDASVRFVQGLEQRLGVQLLAKEALAFLGPDGHVQLFNRRDLRQAVAEGRLRPETPYFDNTVAQRGQLATTWPAPAATTWLARYFTA